MALLGNGKAIKCGPNLMDSIYCTTIDVYSSSKVTKIAAGDIVYLALFDDGHLFASRATSLSNNSYGDYRASGDQVPEKITDIAAGYDSALALGASGSVYQLTFGAGVISFAKVDFPTGVKIKSIDVDATLQSGSEIANGYFAIDTNNNLWHWGKQFTTNTDWEDIPSPVKVQLPAGVTVSQVRAGGGAYSILDTDGNIWVWGRVTSALLGNGTKYSAQRFIQSTPVKVTKPDNIRFVNYDLKLSNATAIDQDGNAWSWGAVIAGNGIALAEPYNVPTKWLAIASTSGSTQTIVNCMPTTGLAPTGLTTIGLLALALSLVGFMVKRSRQLA